MENKANKPIRKIKNIKYNYYGNILYINVHKEELKDLICNEAGITTFKIDPKWEAFNFESKFINLEYKNKNENKNKNEFEDLDNFIF